MLNRRFKSRKELQQHLNKKYENVDAHVTGRGSSTAVLFEAKAKKNIPADKRSVYYSASRPRVHVATYVPSEKKVFTFESKYALKKKEEQTRSVQRRRSYISRSPWGNWF